MEHKKLMLMGVAVLLSGCGSYAPKGSIAWEMGVSDSEVIAYYDSKSVSDLCYTWDKARKRNRVRNHVSDALQRKGYDRYYCHNPEADRIGELEDRIQELEQRPTQKVYTENPVMRSLRQAYPEDYGCSRY